MWVKLQPLSNPVIPEEFWETHDSATMDWMEQEQAGIITSRQLLHNGMDRINTLMLGHVDYGRLSVLFIRRFVTFCKGGVGPVEMEQADRYNVRVSHMLIKWTL